jgi:hypothetical protein
MSESRLIANIGIRIKEPAGTVVPLENVKSRITPRVIWALRNDSERFVSLREDIGLT